ncbi:MAG: radical SAM family heme chaperone HemW [Bacteroidales bacterium]|nr:radical SAM family heme chaperone HemW [Bacteroidales bacterium]
MAGIYIHIPYCRKVCYYCDFHFSVYVKSIQSFLKALKHEITIRSNEYNFNGKEVNSIYFGGGTPSVLEINQVKEILNHISENFNICSSPEITFETNPDDLSTEYLHGLKETGINRLSVGIQSVTDRLLKYMNRRHNANDAIECINRVKKAGFDNLNVDLIYGIPGQSMEDLEMFLNFVASELPSHISAYHLTIEAKTVFGNFQKKGTLSAIEEQESLMQYNHITSKLKELGYDHYEISNFALNNMYSKHNLAYWQQKEYLGFGPSAHSYYQNIRRWNISNNTKYIKALNDNIGDYQNKELITKETAYNDYIITALRTKWGVNLKYIQDEYGSTYVDYISKRAKKFIESDDVTCTEEMKIALTEKGMFISDYIMAEFIRI